MSSQTRAANLAISISNVTEIVTMMLGNDSESFSATDQSEMLTVYWIVAISFIMGLLGIVYLLFCHQSIFFILGLVVKACKNACNCVWRVVWLLFEYTGRRSGQRVEVVPPLTSATYVLNNVTNSVKPPSNEATPPRVNEHSSSSFEALSSKVSENLTSNSKHLLVQQSTDSGYHSMPPMPHSPIALLSGKDRRVCVNGEPLHPRFDQQSTRVQYDISSQTTELESVNVLEPVSSPQPTGKKGRTDDSNAKVECTNAENCDPGESDSVSYHRRSPQTDASGGEVQQETTQPSERSSVFAGLTHRCREQTIQILPPIMIQNFVVPPQENVEPSPVQTIALPIGPASDVLAFNATVEETEHVAPDLPEDVPNVTPITLESLFINLERGLQLHVDLADAEVDMFQLQPPPFAQPYASQGDAADSAPVYPPLPGVPFANAELQPVFPPLPALPSTSTPTVVILITYVP